MLYKSKKINSLLSFFFVQSDRLQKVFVYVDEVHGLCAVLGMDFSETVKEVHPSLHGTNSENSTNISDSTLEGLTQTILKLKAEKKTRVLKVIPWRRTGVGCSFLFC
jgi:hypothetical protein